MDRGQSGPGADMEQSETKNSFIIHLYDAVPRLVTTGCMEMVVVRLGQHSKAVEIKRNLQHDYASWLNDFLILELG